MGEKVKLRVLITGGFGYVGGRVAQYLAKIGYQIVLGSRKKQSPPEWLQQAEVVQMHWNDEKSLHDACYGIDIVIHAAGVNAQDCKKYPAQALEFNGVATARLLDACRASGVLRVIYFSTAHVYSSELTGDINESTCPSNLHPYAASKRAAEDAILYEGTKGEVLGIIFRLSNSFGSPTDIQVNCWNLVIPDFCRQAVIQNKITLKSSGMQRRDFIALTDVCRATNHLMTIKKEMVLDGLFNVGGEWAPRVLDVADIIKDRYIHLFGGPISIEMKGVDDYTDNSFHYNIDKLKRTGFSLQSAVNNEIDNLLLFSEEHREALKKSPS